MSMRLPGESGVKSLEFTIDGEVPSKKNSWKPRAGGGMYIPAGVQADIDALLWQLKPIRNKMSRAIAGPIALRLEIVTRTKKQDTDNRHTTMQDVLQMAGIIENDNDVDEIYCRRDVSETSQPRVHVSIFYAA